MTNGLRPLAVLLLAAIHTAAFAEPPAATVASIERALETGDADRIKLELMKLDAATRQQVVSAIYLDTRIVGGMPALVSDFPWQVALVRGSLDEPQRSQFCGGTLIAPDLVVTAAHCLDNPIVRSDAALVHVVAGASAYESGGQRVGVKAIAIHPRWNHATNDYDVAVLRLQAKLSVGRPVKLATAAPAPGVRAWVSGWGATIEGGYGSPQLMAVPVPVVAHDICNAADSYDGALTARMLCAGEREGGKDACQGDSGGPLVTGTTGQERLIGIVSWGEGCARRLKYGVYTDVSSVAEWVAGVANAPAPLVDPTVGGGLFSLSSKGAAGQ